MGAVLVNHGKPVSVGFNKIRHHSRFSWFPDACTATLHAEMSALASSGKVEMRNSEMFIYRENKSTKMPAMARPCEHCMKALKEFGVKRIWYTTNEYPYFDTERI